MSASQSAMTQRLGRNTFVARILGTIAIFLAVLVPVSPVGAVSCAYQNGGAYMAPNTLTYTSLTWVRPSPYFAATCSLEIMHSNYGGAAYAQIRRTNENCQTTSVAMISCAGWNCPQTAFFSVSSVNIWIQTPVASGFSIASSSYAAFRTPSPSGEKCFGRSAV
jgi:ABC-type sugar transport system permease subunit